MTPKCPNCKRDQDDCVCVDEIESLRTQVEELKADAEREIEALRAQVTELKSEIDDIKQVQFPARVEKVAKGWRTKCDELKRQRDEYKADAERYRDALNLWKVASDNAEESELDDMACYCIPMPLFCDACEATEAIDAALAATKGES